MRTGIFGYKGAVHYQCAPCIDDFLRALPADMPKTEFFSEVAARIDHDIHSNYRLYPETMWRSTCSMVALLTATIIRPTTITVSWTICMGSLPD